MLLPEPMSRIVIAGSRSRLDEAIDALYGLEMFHVIDHTTGTDEGFAIGAPRPYSQKASERLLSLRAVEKELNIDSNKDAPDERMTSEEARRKISANHVEAIAAEVFEVLDRKSAFVQKMNEQKAKKDDLSLIADIPVDLDLYKGYQSLSVLVGSVSSDPTEAMSAIADHETFVTGGGKKGGRMVMALFVKKTDKENAMRILTDFEFTEISVPEGSGPAGKTIAETDATIALVEKGLAAVEEELAVLKKKYAADVIALDEELSIETQKGETPLRIATSDHSFVIDAWVPTANVDDAITGLNMRMGGNIFVESEEDRSRSLHDVEKAEERFKDTPTKMKNGAYAKHFEYPVKLLSPPKYQEVDPTIILSIFFPLFFGFMVGDIGYAIPFIILGAYGLKFAKHKDFRAIATVLFFGGLWAFIFGFFFFGEMFGMHFVGHAGDKTHTWESLLGLHFPEWFANIFPHTVVETSPGVFTTHYGISKVGDVTFLLRISIYIGIIHILLGYVVGFMNAKMQHGTREAFFEKGGWIMTFIGLVMFAWAMTEVMIAKADFGGTPLFVLLIGIVIMVAGILVSFKKEGIQAILEVPGVFGNILSYARLTAIGMSKAGMALAFNYISITMIAAGLGGIPGIVVGLLMFSFLHLVIWVLAILSAGLHALRLQYVELMSKFFVGGGTEYTPLEIKRINTKIVETEV